MALQVFFPASRSSLPLDTISSVILVRAQTQMLRVAAPAIVTGMQHEHPLGDRTMRQLPRDPVDGHCLSADLHAAIAVKIARTGPEVTTGLGIDFDIGLKTLND